MNTQPLRNKKQQPSVGPAGRRTALLVMALSALAFATGCRTQKENASVSTSPSPQLARQPQRPSRPAVEPAPASQRITGARAQDAGAQRWLTDEVVTPVEFGSQTPAQEPQPVAAPAAPPQFQTQSQAPVPARAMPSLRPGMADEPVSVNFDNVDIRTVLKTVGDITGINFIPHESVTGNVTVMSPTPIRLGDIYAFLQSILDVHGYATIEMDNAVKVVPKADAAKHHPPVRIGGDPAYIPKVDVVVTQMMPLKYADADEVRQIIEPIVSTGAQLATYPRTNLLMITDTSANIRRVAEVVQQLDVEGSQEKALTFPLMHASARVLSEQITRIMEKNRTTAAPQAGRSATGPASAKAQILPDDRTNSLIVIAGEQDIEMIRGLVQQLDIQRPVGVNNVHVVYLKNADANEVGRSLDQALAGMKLAGAVEAAQQIQVTPDPSTNALVIVASPQDFEVVSQIVEKLDIVRDQVLVEMLILEVTEETLKEIGVDWATLDNAVSDSVRGFGMTNLDPRVNFLNGTSEGLNVGAWRGSDNGAQIGAILHALQKQSGVNILSTPSILTSNHRKAQIIVGENRPFVTESRITETNNPITPTVIKSFEYKDVGITLDITPHISQGGLIRLDLDTEFTKLIEDVTTLSVDTPATAKRTAKTAVTMGSGATVVIGGLIRDDTTHAVKKVPLVGDLPLVGALFRSERDRTEKTNLLLFITPHIMSTQDDLIEMTDRKKREMTMAQEEDER
ncbi:MAG: type II secretion system secretin GspD [Planctomycetes bacterium]|nr:type II secretion system secretin GspD [Planctomycetota bacterium]